MENRYLFRGKRIDNGEWVQGNLIQSCDATDGWETIIIPIKNSNMFTKHIKRGYGNLGFENWYRVDPSTICQCTGLKDKNGKLIWQNDILLQKTTEKHWCEWQRMGLVKYGEHDWNEGVYGYKNIGLFVEPIVKEGDETRMKPGLCQEDLVFENYPYEVIGNIFDNPELLEV